MKKIGKPDSRIWVPGDPQNAKEKLLVAAKRILVPQGGQVEQAHDELQLARTFSRAERRHHTRIGLRLKRRQRRQELRRQRNLDEALFRTSSQRYDREKNRIVRFDSRGKPLTVIERPVSLKVRTRTGYLEANGPEKLEKSPDQARFEQERPRALFEPRRKRQRGSFAWPQSKGEERKAA